MQLANKVVLLTAAKLSGQAFAKPRVISVLASNILGGPTPSNSSGFTAVKLAFPGQAQPKQDAIVYESPTEVEAQMSQDLTNDLIAKQKIKSGIAAAGNNAQGGGATIGTYMNEFTTVTTGSADSVDLPLVVNYGQKNPVVIINNGAGTLNVFPGVGDKIDGGAANAKTTVAAGKRKTLVALAALTWTTCDDYTQ